MLCVPTNPSFSRTLLSTRSMRILPPRTPRRPRPPALPSSTSSRPFLPSLIWPRRELVRCLHFHTAFALIQGLGELKSGAAHFSIWRISSYFGMGQLTEEKMRALFFFFFLLLPFFFFFFFCPFLLSVSRPLFHSLQSTSSARATGTPFAMERHRAPLQDTSSSSSAR